MKRNSTTTTHQYRRWLFYKRTYLAVQSDDSHQRKGHIYVTYGDIQRKYLSSNIKHKSRSVLQSNRRVVSVALQTKLESGEGLSHFNTKYLLVHTNKKKGIVVSVIRFGILKTVS